MLKNVQKVQKEDHKVRHKIGTWRSLEAHLNGVQGVASSNLAVPTIKYIKIRLLFLPFSYTLLNPCFFWSHFLLEVVVGLEMKRQEIYGLSTMRYLSFGSREKITAPAHGATSFLGNVSPIT